MRIFKTARITSLDLVIAIVRSRIQYTYCTYVLGKKGSRGQEIDFYYFSMNWKHEKLSLDSTHFMQARVAYFYSIRSRGYNAYIDFASN